MNKQEIIELLLKDAWSGNDGICYVEDNRIIATDKCIVIVFEDCPEEELVKHRHEKVNTNVKKFLDGYGHINIKGNCDPMKIEVPSIDCKWCEGTGKTDKEVECPYCNGRGDSHCHSCNHDYDCEKCRGKGFIVRGKEPCDECSAAGKVPGGVVIDGVRLGGKYVNILKILPGCSLELGAAKPLWFTFEGGHGALMPMVNP